MQIDKDQIGMETYPFRNKGGQQVGIINVGIRMWYPKHKKDDPLIDIRINTERSQLKNRNLAKTLIDLILEEN